MGTGFISKTAALALGIAQASCGGRVLLHDFGSDAGEGLGGTAGGGATGAAGASGGRVLGAPELASLQCTGSTGDSWGLARNTYIDGCRWHVAEPVDPASPDITFTEWQALTLTHVSGPGGCSGVNGLGWYALENVPGKIVAADAVMTFEICPEACKEIGNGEGWTISYRIKPCG